MVFDDFIIITYRRKSLGNPQLVRTTFVPTVWRIWRLSPRVNAFNHLTAETTRTCDFLKTPPDNDGAYDFTEIIRVSVHLFYVHRSFHFWTIGWIQIGEFVHLLKLKICFGRYFFFMFDKVICPWYLKEMCFKLYCLIKLHRCLWMVTRFILAKDCNSEILSFCYLLMSCRTVENKCRITSVFGHDKPSNKVNMVFGCISVVVSDMFKIVFYRKVSGCLLGRFIDA